MRYTRHLTAALAAGTLLIAAAVTGSAHAGQPTTTAGPVRAAATAPTAPPRSVTLVTGDKVTVLDGTGRMSVQRAPGRQDITFLTETTGGRLRVVPSDAAPLLAAGRLDPRLFDVSTLLEFGYDKREDLPLIVTRIGNAAARAAVDGLTVVRDLPAVGGTAVRQSRATAAESWRGLIGADTGTGTGKRALRSGLTKIWLDGRRKPALDVSVPQIGAPAAWAAGHTGAGVTVAVLDSGVDDTHPDLAGRVGARQNFTDGYEDGRDLAGHGTHVAATLAGSGAGSADGRYRGVAPGATLLDGKVCVVGGCAESWILAGMQWAAADKNAKIVNLSLGGFDDPAVEDPLEQAVRTLSNRYGTLFVVAVGNADGPADYSIWSPATADAALSVGAVDASERLANFSVRGPRGGDDALKPDLTAPGVDITAARGRDATNVPGSTGDRYTNLSGTSMAAPHVAGSAALLAQAHPDWSGTRLKAALMASAHPNPTTGVYGQGAGRVDVGRAVGQTVSTAPASVSFGGQSWPHGDDPVLTRQVSYHNAGRTEVLLDLVLAVNGPDGAPAPAGMFGLSARTVTVPAGGDASVTLTADTRTAGVTGFVGGRLTATAGDLVVTTPVALRVEEESYDVTLTHVDRSGGAPEYYSTALVNREGRQWPYRNSGGPEDATVTFRVPAGPYTVISTMLSEASGEGTLLAQPTLDVDADQSIVVDGRLARPVSVTVPRAGAVSLNAEVGATARFRDQTAGNTVGAGSFAKLFAGRLGPDRADPGFLSNVAGQFAQADAEGGTADSPYAYLLMFPERGHMISGYSRRVRDTELAQVQADFAQTMPGTVGVKQVSPGIADFDKGGYAVPMTFRLPFTRTEYYSTDPGVEYLGSSGVILNDEWISNTMAPVNTTYRAGKRYREQWNRGVFGPSFPVVVDDIDVLRRLGDKMWVNPPTYTDGAGRGGSAEGTRTIVLYRDGVRLAEVSEPSEPVQVPPGDALYRLEVQVRRGPPMELSTEVVAAWSFRSGHVDGDSPTSLPLWGARFSPQLDQNNAVAAGRVHTVGVTMTPQYEAAVGTAGAPVVEVSFDDGATWAAVPVRDNAVSIRHPAGRGFVSLRAKATDSKGNSMDSTTIRAYRFG